MLTDNDENELDFVIDMASLGKRVWVSTAKDGGVCLQVEGLNAYRLESPLDVVLAYLIGGAVAKPPEGEM